MGYRLNIKEMSNEHIPDFYGTKLFGYLNGQEENSLSSAKYLKELGLMDDSMFFFYGSDNKFILNHDQFTEFIKRYSKDLTEYGDEIHKNFNLLDNTLIQRLMESLRDKIISWN